MIACVGNQQVAGSIEGEAKGQIEQRVDRVGTVTAVSRHLRCACNRRDDVGGGVHAADNLVLRVGEVEVAGTIQNKARGGCNACGSGRAAVAGISLYAITDDGGDHAGDGIDATDAVVAGVAKQDVAGGVDDDTLGREDGCGGGSDTVCSICPGTAAGHSVDAAWNQHGKRAGRIATEERGAERAAAAILQQNGAVAQARILGRKLRDHRTLLTCLVGCSGSTRPATGEGKIKIRNASRDGRGRGCCAGDSDRDGDRQSSGGTNGRYALKHLHALRGSRPCNDAE